MSQQIKDIIQDMSAMSEDEIREKILQLRRTRNVKAVVSSKAKDRPAKKSKKKDTLVSLLASMNDEDRNKLIAKLSE